MDEIEAEIKKGTSPKWAILKEKAEAEILRMIEAGIPLEKQIELLLKHKIVEKLERKEYTKIITNHFGYQGAKRTPAKSKQGRSKKRNTTAQPAQARTETAKHTKREDKKKSIEDRLSEDVDLMSGFLAKKANQGTAS